MKRIKITDIDKDDLEFLVCGKKFSKKLISKIMGCSIDLISKCIYEFNIKSPEISDIIKAQYNNGRSVNCKLYDIPTKEDMDYMYNERGWSMNRLSKLFDTSIPTLKKWMIKHGIYIRNNSESQIREINEGIIYTIEIASKDDLKYLYIERGFSLSIIGKMFDVSSSMIRKWMNEYHIKIRSCSSGMQRSYDENHRTTPFRDIEFQNELYKNKVEYSVSRGELELREFIKTITCSEIVPNYRKLGRLMELDIYLPELNLAFEFNGLYWHSDQSVDKNYHKNKTDKCREQGIRLIHVWEDDWDYNRDTTEAWIANIINPQKENKIYGRKCEVKFIEPSVSKYLMDTFHIQGYVNSSVCVGLYYEERLISACLFSKKDDNSYYLTRYVVLPEYSVIGGFSKMIKLFSKTYDKDLYTFADLSWVNSEKNVYLSNNFVPDKVLSPDYAYVYDKIRTHKFNFRHKHLKKKFKENYDPSLTEHENCLNNNVYRIYDCGKIRYKYIKET